MWRPDRTVRGPERATLADIEELNRLFSDAFTDPVDGSTATAQGIRLLLDGDARIVVRLSGTGTRGATIRLYLEQVGSGTPRVTDDVQSQLASVIAVALTVTNIATHTGRPAPSVIT